MKMTALRLAGVSLRAGALTIEPTRPSGRLLNIPLEIGRGIFRKLWVFPSRINLIEALLAQHLEDDPAEVSA